MIQLISEIENQYNGYYVFIDQCEFNELSSVVKGRVLFAEKDKEVFNARAKSTATSGAVYELSLTPLGKGYFPGLYVWLNGGK